MATAVVSLGAGAPHIAGDGAGADHFIPDDPVYGVYYHLVRNAGRSIDEVADRLRRGIGAAGGHILSEYAVGVDRDDCAFDARVLAIDVPEYAELVTARGLAAAFALPLRLAVYEDEGGVHIAAVNPRSINRTIIAETGFEEATGAIVARLDEFVAHEFRGARAHDQYGQFRSRGLIGKTMGLIAGGPFPSKIERVARVRLDDGADLATVADRLYAELEKLGGSRRWGIRPVYRYDVANHGVVIIGVTGDAMEARAFGIVGHGSRDRRKDLACPGLDHAAAFPIEVVLTRDGDRVDAYMIDGMFRMKMYFEDAGKMKFAANMRMPGSIEDEIRDKIEESLY